MPEVEAEPRQGEATTLRTLERGLALLGAVAAADGRATAKVLSRDFGLKLGTCYHLLRTLRDNGYVTRLPGGAYGLGPRAVALGRDLQQQAGAAPELLAILTRLHNQTNETAYICGWYHGVITLQEFIAGTHQLSVGGLNAGYTGNMHARASCRAVLAQLPTEVIATMFDGITLAPLTAHTIVDYDQLLNELLLVRQRGFAIDREEFTDGVCCVAAAFVAPDGRPAGSYAVSVPTSRFDRGATMLTAEVRRAAAMATKLIADGRVAAPSSPHPAHESGRGTRRTVA